MPGYLDDNGYHEYPPPLDAATDPPEAPPQQFDVFALASVICALFGLLIWQVALGPLAIVLGAVGVHTSQSSSARRMAIVGYAWGAFDGLLWLVIVSVFHVSGFPL
jgi:hypothetical protein